MYSSRLIAWKESLMCFFPSGSKIGELKVWQAADLPWMSWMSLILIAGPSPPDPIVSVSCSQSKKYLF